eukprot:1710534-Rhodomonas_salina.4
MPPGAPYVGTGVKAYTIHPSLSAFRHWDETAEELPAGAKMEWAPSQAACATSTTDTENDDKIVDERNDPSTSASISSHGRAQWLFAAAFVALSAHAAFPWV